MWSEADAAFEPFEIMVPEDYLARNVNQSYDFSRTHTYSDLDISRLELGAGVRYQASERIGLRAGYRYIDFEDNAPYLEDTTGSVDFYSIAVAWAF